jgi:hypothetical protein
VDRIVGETDWSVNGRESGSSDFTLKNNGESNILQKHCIQANDPVLQTDRSAQLLLARAGISFALQKVGKSVAIACDSTQQRLCLPKNFTTQVWKIAHEIVRTAA